MAACRAVKAGLISLLVVIGLVAAPGVSSAATGDVGFVGPSYTGATSPTADKPQSKMWYTDGRWWANMFDPVSADWHIFYLDRAAQKWVDTKVAVDTRPATSSDTLWDGQYLYIGTHGLRTGSNASSTTTPMRLYRYSYNSSTKAFVLNSGFPKTISQNSSESLTIDRDSKGTVWATWTRVSGSTGEVMVNNGTSNGSTWGTPFVVPTTGGLNNPSVNPTVAVDDISALVAFGQNKIGLLWSNQRDGHVYWSVHADGAGRTTWTGGYAVKGNNVPDDHLNIKSIQADTQGRVVAAVKTSLDTAGAGQDAAQINLLTYKPGTGAGTWSSTTFGRIRDCHTRPQVVLDESNSKVYVFASGPTGTGACTSTGAGAIYMKSTSLDAPSFATGLGTVVMRDAASENLNNVTATKQSATSASGIVVLASNDSTKRYWHADVVPGGATPPPAGDTTAPTVPTNVAATVDGPTQVTVSWTASTDNVGVASYRVTRGTTVVGSAVTGTSFVDSTVAADTTYSYTVSAVDAAGNRSAESGAATVTTPPPTTSPPGGAVSAGLATTAGNTATVTSATLVKPGDVRAGDVLIAQITADDHPDVAAAPAGWSTVVAPQSVGTSARLFVYYKVVTDPAVEPSSYTWTFSVAVKWNGGVAGYHGVNTSTPWDTAAVSATKTSGSTSITLPGVTTTTAGAMVVGGVGPNSSSVTAAPPSGWTEVLEATGAQTTEVAHQSRPTAGATGTATWTLSGSVTSTAWMRALRPA